MSKQHCVMLLQDEEILYELNLCPKAEGGNNRIWCVKCAWGGEGVIQRKIELEECSNHKTHTSDFKSHQEQRLPESADMAQRREDLTWR